MHERYDPKDLTRWLELDYFRRRPLLYRRLRSWSWYALGGAAVFVLLSLWPANHRVYQAGPLSTAHAMFNNNCNVCHTEPFQTVSRLWPGAQHVYSVPDQACLQCHPGSAHQGIHPWNKVSIKAEKCTSCHREHHGNKQLAHVADGYCTTCHAALQTQHETTAFRNVSSFTAHPEFALWGNPRDTGNVTFNHAKHLALEPKSCNTGKEVAAKLKQQQCSYCHQPDPAGRYMQPIRFEQHCKDCHPIQIRVAALPMAFAATLKDKAEQFAKTPVPHPQAGETPETVHALLRERFLQFARDNSEPLKLLTLKLPEPAERPLLLPMQGPPASKAELEWSEQQVASMEKLLFGVVVSRQAEDGKLFCDKADGCGRCHNDLLHPATKLGDLRLNVKPQVPVRWLEHSVFSHQAHQMLNCAECHAEASLSKVATDVLMPKLATCQSCHSPKGGARSDCVECHKFHNPDKQWQGSKSISQCTALGG